MPGHVDGNEIAVRAVLGQQVTVAAARTIAARLTAELGKPVARPDGELTHLFPDVATLATLAPEDLPMPRSRGRALDGSVPRRSPRATSCWTAAPAGTRRGRPCSRSRASGRGPPTTSRCARSATPTSSCPPTSAPATPCSGSGADPAAAAELAQAWRPWRSYAQVHLWRTLTETTTNQEK